MLHLHPSKIYRLLRLISGCNEDNTTNILNMFKHLSRLIDITNTNRGMIVQDGDERSSQIVITRSISLIIAL